MESDVETDAELQGGLEDERRLITDASEDAAEFENDDDAFPFRSVLPIALVTLAEGFQGSVLIPFVAFMVRDLTGLPVRKIGFLAGFLTTAFFLGQLLGTYFIGKLSDRIGRKPVLLFGMAANCVCSLGFGFSVNMVMAVGFRLLNGILNGSVGVVKSFIRESSSPKHQASAFGSTLTLAYSYSLLY